MGWSWNRNNKNKHKHKHTTFLVAIKLKMKCPICLEHKFVGKMVQVDGCSHTFCYPCMKKYMDQCIKKRRTLIICPHARCEAELNYIHRYMKFLSLTSMAALKLLNQEIIPASELIHCPNPKCFALMSVKEAMKGENINSEDKNKSSRKCRSSTNVVVNHGKCIGCEEQFCVNCRVPWHWNMTCVEYRRFNPTAEVDAQFSALVSTMGWSKCPECTQTIEQVSGCPHMICRCGSQFSYEWWSSDMNVCD